MSTSYLETSASGTNLADYCKMAMDRAEIVSMDEVADTGAGEFDPSLGFNPLLAPQQTFSYTFTEVGEFSVLLPTSSKHGRYRIRRVDGVAMRAGLASFLPCALQLGSHLSVQPQN